MIAMPAPIPSRAGAAPRRPRLLVVGCGDVGLRVVRALGGRLAHPRVVGQPQVVVRAQQQHRPAVEEDAGPLRAVDEAKLAVEPAVAELLEAFGEECEHCKGRGVIVHDHPVE